MWGASVGCSTAGDRRAMGKELPFPFHPAGAVRNDAGCADRERKKKKKNEKGSFGQTFISRLVLTNRAGGAADAAASRASRQTDAYRDAAAKAHAETRCGGLANAPNE